MITASGTDRAGLWPSKWYGGPEGQKHENTTTENIKTVQITERLGITKYDFKFEFLCTAVGHYLL